MQEERPKIKVKEISASNYSIVINNNKYIEQLRQHLVTT